MQQAIDILDGFENADSNDQRTNDGKLWDSCIEEALQKVAH